MSKDRIFRGQAKKYDKCLFVPSALRGYSSSGIACCNDCSIISKVEKFIADIGIDTNKYKNELKDIPKQWPFQDCADDIPYIFWLSIVFCEPKFSHASKNTSFSGGGAIPYSIDKGFFVDNDGNVKPNVCVAGTIEEYAKKLTLCSFENDPPDYGLDNFIRKYMDHQHYCRESWDYEYAKKIYKCEDGRIIDGNDLPDHFTFLLDWTESKCVAEEFAGDDGTIVSINLENYIQCVGKNYKMSYDDEIVERHFFIDTAEKQKSVVTFWPWTFTIDELEKNEFGHALDFRRE
jgi:hypothetical protein